MSGILLLAALAALGIDTAVPAESEQARASEEENREALKRLQSKMAAQAVEAQERGRRVQDRFRQKSEPEFGAARVGKLIDELKDPDVEKRKHAAGELARAGAAGRSAIPALIRAMGDSEKFVRFNASLALSNMIPESLPALGGALGAGDSPTKLGAIYALTRMNRAQDVLGGLLRCLQDRDRAVAAAAAKALAPHRKSPQVARALARYGKKRDGLWKPATTPYSASCRPGECQAAAEKILPHSGGTTVSIQHNPKVDDPIAQHADCLDQVMTCVQGKGALGDCVKNAGKCPPKCRQEYARLSPGKDDMPSFDDVFLSEGAFCRPSEQQVSERRLSRAPGPPAAVLSGSRTRFGRR